jgi:hypothetical protein
MNRLPKELNRLVLEYIYPTYYELSIANMTAEIRSTLNFDFLRYKIMSPYAYSRIYIHRPNKELDKLEDLYEMHTYLIYEYDNSFDDRISWKKTYDLNYDDGACNDDIKQRFCSAYGEESACGFGYTNRIYKISEAPTKQLTKTEYESAFLPGSEIPEQPPNNLVSEENGWIKAKNPIRRFKNKWIPSIMIKII